MRNLSIQGLRGIAALIVFFSHALLIPEFHLESIKESPLHFFFDGQISVMVFIVLSGFFFYNKNVDDFRGYLTTVKRKAIRIYMPYVFITILAFFLLNICCKIPYNHSDFTVWGNSFWLTDVSFIELLKQCSILWPHDADLINPPSWYLAIEVRLFILIPLLLFLERKNNQLSRFVMLCFVVMMVAGILKFVGACLCGYFAHFFLDYAAKKAPQFLDKKIIKVFLALLSLFLLNINNEFNVQLNVSYSLQAIGAALLVAIVYSTDLKLLSNKAAVWLGNISYEFYLVHFIVILALRPLYHDGISYTIVTLLISLILAYCVSGFVHISKKSQKPIEERFIPQNPLNV